MKIILKQDVDNLGYKNDVVTVKNGYGLNFLIPQGHAVLATPSNVKILEENLRQQAHKAAKVKAEAEAIAAKLEGLKLSICAKVGDGGKIFGSVNTIQIADALKGKGFEIERKHISLSDNNIKTTGAYVATVRLHKEVSKEIEFDVIEE